jgi:alkyldihydroxyacetonephosphate synthase
VSLTADLLEDLTATTGVPAVTDPLRTETYAHDWWPRLLMRRRAGEALRHPDAVVAPRDRTEVAAVVRWAGAHHVPLVPFGAGTGVCGGAAPVEGAITLDLKHLQAIGELDEVSGIVEVEAGVIAQRLEEHLQHRGWTLGHHPSSAHCSTMGGFLAIRSAGQASALHGKLEDMVVALEVVLADGEVLTTRIVPQSSSGPDLRRPSGPRCGLLGLGCGAAGHRGGPPLHAIFARASRSALAPDRRGDSRASVSF